MENVRFIILRASCLPSIKRSWVVVYVRQEIEQPSYVSLAQNPHPRVNFEIFGSTARCQLLLNFRIVPILELFAHEIFVRAIYGNIKWLIV